MGNEGGLAKVAGESTLPVTIPSGRARWAPNPTSLIRKIALSNDRRLIPLAPTSASTPCTSLPGASRVAPDTFADFLELGLNRFSGSIPADWRR